MNWNNDPLSYQKWKIFDIIRESLEKYPDSDVTVKTVMDSIDKLYINIFKEKK